MLHRAWSAPLGVGILFAAASAALAESPGPVHWLYDRSAASRQESGQFFASFTLNAGVQHLPRFNTNVFILAGGVTPVTKGSFQENILGFEPGGEIGYVFRDGTLPDWAGSRARVALFGSAYFANATTGATTRVQNFAILAFQVTGRAFASGVAGVGDFTETLKISREGFRLGAKLETDIALAPDLSLTPSAGVAWGQARDVYEYVGRFATTTGTNLGISTLHERLVSDQYGGFLGARLTWQFRPGWAVDMGGTGGAAFVDSRLNARSCVSPSIVPANQPCPAGTSAGTASAAVKNSTVGFVGTASIGLTADLRFALVSLGGFMRYDSQIPAIRNPQSTSQAALVTGPVRIRYTDGFAYGGHLTLRLILP